MEVVTKNRTLIQQMLDTLGPGHTVVRDAQQTLEAKGFTVARRTLYQVVADRSHKREWVEALVGAAEAEAGRQANLKARAARLAA